jgi:hypothetical protein
MSTSLYLHKKYFLVGVCIVSIADILLQLPGYHYTAIIKPELDEFLTYHISYSTKIRLC